ncbi:MAG: siphovirus Gp157 family protein [Ruminococcus sp.]|nr:siphovirus Gp157 family protein [Ruminococcus sp.]
MLTLYEINSALLECVDEETGEVIDFERLNELLMERDEKIEKVALWIKDLDALAVSIKAERDAFDKRMKSAVSKAESLRNWLKNALDGQKFETAKVCVSFRKSEQTEVDMNVLDKKWFKEKVSYTPDKTAIKNAIKSGQTVEGARIVVNQNVQIK